MKESQTKPKSFFQPPNQAKLLWLSFLLLIFSIALLQPNFKVLEQRISAPDLIFGGVFVLWIISLILKKTRFRWHPIFWVLIFYFLAMIVSAIFSDNHTRSFFKLFAELYLIGLAVLTFNLVRTLSQLKGFCRAWLGGTFLVVLVGIISIFLFYFFPQNPFLNYTLSHYGAVPVGNYPRVLSTLYSSSLLCNYLVVSLAILFIAEKFGWLNGKIFQILYFLILLTSVFTISSGLGGIALILGVWVWFLYRDKNFLLSKLLLFGGIFSALFFYLLSFFALEIYKNVPYSFSIPFIEKTFFPSSRVLVWTDSFKTFFSNPFTGVGIGQDSCQVIFTNTDGTTSLYTDAHNIYLSIASQTGLLGLFALLTLIFFLFREIFPLNLTNKKLFIIRIILGLAFFVGFLYQGLFGSFEDARHLWVLMGLILSFGNSINTQNE